MPRSSAGKWVARAAATGGGRTYRGQVPANWYAALVVIVVLGILSIVYARYQYQHPSAAASTVQPAVGTTWYAGFDFDVCGTQAPSPPSNATVSAATKQSFYTTGDGVITIAPKTGADAGDNAVLGKFVDGYHGMRVTSSAIAVPSSKSTTTYHNGQACPKGTPDAGKKGSVQVADWANAFDAKAKRVVVNGDPADLKFANNQLITVGFVPAGTKLPKPNGSVVIALVKASTSNSATSTTAPATSTTAPATSTTAPATSTTAPATSTTAPATSTTAPKKK